MRLIVIILLCLCSSTVQGQKFGGYTDEYFDVLNYLIRYPYDFLGRTEYELISLTESPPGMPISRGYWGVEKGRSEAVNPVIIIKTGYSPLFISINKKSNFSFSFDYPGSSNLGITLDVIKDRFSANGITFSKHGISKVQTDRLNRGKYIIKLTIVNTEPIIRFVSIGDTTIWSIEN